MSAGLGAKQQKLLDEFVQRTQAAAGGNLRSIVLYGSAATEDYRPEISDLNLLVLLHALDASALGALREPLRWWHGRQQIAPLLFTLEELRRSADVFAIELLDIQARHRTLHGPDEISGIAVPMGQHRLQLERELRTNLIRLRQRYLVAADDDALLMLMLQSASAFHTLFRHTLIALGETASWDRRETTDALQRALRVDVSPLRTLLDLREGKIAAKNINVTETFSNYLAALSAAADEVDRRLPRSVSTEPLI